MSRRLNTRKSTIYVSSYRSLSVNSHTTLKRSPTETQRNSALLPAAPGAREFVRIKMACVHFRC